MLAPILAAGQSPLLAWRDPIYIAAGFAGIAAFALLLLQPILAAGPLQGQAPRQTRRIHQGVGGVLVSAVLIHVIGLWLTSPPDVIDALLFVSPTPFSDWGVIAMWALFAAGALSVIRHRLPPRFWRLGHTSLVVLVSGCTILHALLIEGTMEPVTKWLLSLLVALATLRAVWRRRVWAVLARRG